MPLRQGKSKKTVSENIRTEMHSYRRSGKLGTSHPKSDKKAQKQAVAIALSKARESGAKIPKKGHSKKTDFNMPEAGNNKYLTKIAEVMNKIKEDMTVATKRSAPINERFFTRQKLRGT